jgi:REP element-mobilizing transposase RayT
MYRRRLPHYDAEGAYIFATWRLWGTLPATKASYATPGKAFVAMDRNLHRAATGPLHLKDPRVAQIVAEAIQAGAEIKHYYELDAWVVMANHVHLLIRPLVPLRVITRWLKGLTARRANELLSRTGPFWQDESHDHVVRTHREWESIIRYIENNPRRYPEIS